MTRINAESPAEDHKAAPSLPRADAPAKVAGSERFASDHYPEGLLWAGALRSPVASGRLRGLDLAAARALPGVVCVLTAADAPGSNRQGIVHQDQPVLVTDRIRSRADALALVTAADKASLRRALALIRADVEPLPGVFDPLEALRPGAPLVHEDRPGNLLSKFRLEKGDARGAFAACRAVVSGSFATQAQAHAFLETENGLARLRGDGVLDMTVSTQAPFRDRFEIGQALGLDPFRIRIRAPHLGGGFGGKDGATVQCLLGLAALRADGRPVRMTWEREESLAVGVKRHPSRVFLKLGAAADGTLLALSCRLVFDAGAYAHLSSEILLFGMEHISGPYRVPNLRVDGLAALTNNPSAGPFRGFGAVQTCFALESCINALAARLGLDPLEFRLRNALRPGEKNGAGVPMEGPAGVAECLEALSRSPVWTGREAWIAAAPPLTRRGVGLAAGWNAMGYGRGLPDAAAAKLELTPDGRFRIFNSVPDMGQGNAAAFRELAASALSQDPDAFEIVQPDTARCLPAGSSSASRTTYVFGNALLMACAAMREKLLARAALFFLRDEVAALTLAPGRVLDVPSGRELPLARLAAALTRDDRVCAGQSLMPVVAEPTQTTPAARLGFPHRFFAHAACLVAAEVDELTGVVTPKAVVSAVEGGRVLNRQCLEQQIQGATAQSLGLALAEDCAIREGRVENDGLGTYLAPLAPDLPDMEVLVVDSHEPSGPAGLKGVGEVGIHAPAPALAAAVEQACGHVARRLPILPQETLAALAASNKEPL